MTEQQRKILERLADPDRCALMMDDIEVIEAALTEIDRLTDQATMDRAGIARMADEIDRLRAANEELTEACGKLEKAEAAYRIMHDVHGDGSLQAGRAWDTMRRCGDRARAALAAAEAIASPRDE